MAEQRRGADEAGGEPPAQPREPRNELDPWREPDARAEPEAGSEAEGGSGAEVGAEAEAGAETRRRFTRREALRRGGMAAAVAPLVGLAACTDRTAPVAAPPSVTPSPDPPPPPEPSATPSPAPPPPAPTARPVATRGRQRAMHPEFMDIPPVDLPRPGAGNGMNVVVVVLDSLRLDHVGAYGATDVDTPALDELARRSTRFTGARPEAMPTVQVRRCLHTGQRSFPARRWWPRKGGRVRMPGWEPIPEDQVTLAEMLESAGYYTSLITDVPHLFHPSMNFHRGFQHWDLIRGQYNGMFRGGGAERRTREQDHQAPKVFATATRMLAAAARLRPFLMVVDSYDPHEPWDPPTSYVRRYGEATFAGPEPFTLTYGPSSQYTPAQLDRMRVLYRAEVTMADAWLGRFLDALDERRLLDDTLVVLLSDHGVLIGERGLIGKPVGDSLWPEITDIPLLVHHPEDRRERVDDRLVSTHDIVPTVLSALGIRPPVALPGLDLTPILRGRARKVRRRDHLTMGYASFAQILTDRWAMTTDAAGTRRRLYDLRAAGFRRDVASSHPDVVRRLAGRIEQDAGGPLPVHDSDAVVQRLGERP